MTKLCFTNVMLFYLYELFIIEKILWQCINSWFSFSILFHAIQSYKLIHYLHHLSILLAFFLTFIMNERAKRSYHKIELVFLDWIKHKK